MTGFSQISGHHQAILIQSLSTFSAVPLPLASVYSCLQFCCKMYFIVLISLFLFHGVCVKSFNNVVNC